MPELFEKLARKGEPTLGGVLGGMMALHTATEDYCITLFELSDLAAIYAHPITIELKDMRLVQMIYREKEMLNRLLEMHPK